MRYNGPTSSSGNEENRQKVNGQNEISNSTDKKNNSSMSLSNQIRNKIGTGENRGHHSS
jgi:hypothetical protein